MNAHSFWLSATLFAVAAANMTLSDISGEYRLEKGTLEFCKPTIAFTNVTRRLRPENVVVGGKRCMSGAADLIIMKNQISSDVLIRTPDISCNNIKELECNNLVVKICQLWFHRPHEDRNRTSKYLGNVAVKKGESYFLLIAKNGACQYIRVSGSSQNPLPRNPDRSPALPSTQPGMSPMKPTPIPSLKPTPSNAGNTESKSPWNWLGPVLGSISTVVAALLGIACAQKERTRRKSAAEVIEKHTVVSKWSEYYHFEVGFRRGCHTLFLYLKLNK